MRMLTSLLIMIFLTSGAQATAAERVTVFAAASLTEAVEEIGASYRKEAGTEVVFSFAASSVLSRQVEAGAPADLIALASPDWADYLAERGLILPETRVDPIGNRLAVIAPPGSTVALPDPPTAAAFRAALGADGRLAIGDPAHVPAGIYARQALESLGLWQDLESRLAFAGDVRGAMALVERGEAPLGIVYATDLRAVPAVRLVALLPEGSHAPIAYPFAVVAGGNTGAATRFLQYLTGQAGLAVFARHGFVVR